MKNQRFERAFAGNVDFHYIVSGSERTYVVFKAIIINCNAVARALQTVDNNICIVLHTFTQGTPWEYFFYTFMLLCGRVLVRFTLIYKFLDNYCGH